MRVIVVIALAAALATAACEREQQAPPASSAPAAPDTVPDTAPAQELPAPSTTSPTAEPQPGTSGTPPVAQPPGGAPAARGRTPQNATSPRPGASRPPSGGATPPAVSEPSPAAAQDAGAAVLQRASTAYANMRSLKADFVMQYSNPLLRQQTTSRGTLYQRRPDRIALRFTDPAGDVILSDGEFYWIYYPSVDAQQVISCPVTEGGEQGVDLQAQFVGDPVRRFRHTLHEQETVGGRPAHVLTLEPRERADYRTLRVWLDTRDTLARRFEITEHNGTVRRFELSNFELNVAIPDATFRFTPPANARTVSCG